MSKKILLVTIALGEKYLKQYHALFGQSQLAYAQKYGYDFKVVTDFIDSELSNRHPATISFQKILVCQMPGSEVYDKIVYVDADVFINVDAPPIHEIDTHGKVGIVNEYLQPTYQERLAIQKRERWEDKPSDYYLLASSDFVLDTDKVLNTGVMIFEPQRHKEFLYGIYAKHVANAIGHPRKFHFEQSAIGYEIQKAQLFHLIDNKWNAVWLINILAEGQTKSLFKFYQNNYFLHFAGNTGIDKIPMLKRSIQLRKLVKNIPFLNRI